MRMYFQKEKLTLILHNTHYTRIPVLRTGFIKMQSVRIHLRKYETKNYSAEYMFLYKLTRPLI